MRLIKLTSNKDSFHTVNFNETGLSLIVGRKENRDEKNIKKTYNSVGKSLIICLVHFCLGSNFNDELEKKLPDWEFSLEFIIDGVSYISERKTSSQMSIYLNNKEYSLNDFRSFLGEKIFYLKNNIKYVTFRSLLSRFIRPKKNSYVQATNFENKEQEYARLINNAYLLGLDIESILKKVDLKSEYDTNDKLLNTLKKDPEIKQFFSHNKDSEVLIVNLEEKILKLENNIKNFKIAEDYNQIKKEADYISSKLRELRNKVTKLENAIKDIDKSLTLKIDISKEKILKLYEEANIYFSDLIVKKLDDIENFNSQIVKNRQKRLFTQKQSLEKKLNELTEEIYKNGQIEDKKLSYLNSYGALEEYTSLNNQLTDYKIQLEKLKSYRELVTKYKNNLSEIKIEFNKEDIKANKYLNSDIKQILDSNISLFKSISNRFYENKIAGIEVSNNESLNKLRYNLDVKIHGDAGDGVNEVRIFCFDWTLLLGKHNHEMNMIFHDGRLLADMDPRQVSTLLKFSYEATLKNNLQYILSINENMLESTQEYLTEEEYSHISNCKILELTDKSEKTKLLGIQVDLNYERE